MGLFDKRDRADELYESETSGPVSGRTRKRIQEEKHEASRLSDQNGDDRPGRSGDHTTNGNVQKCHKWQTDKLQVFGGQTIQLVQ